MIQVQVLVQENGKFIESEFKKIKVAHFTFDECNNVFPVLGEVVISTNSVIVVEYNAHTITFIKQAYVK